MTATIFRKTIVVAGVLLSSALCATAKEDGGKHQMRLQEYLDLQKQLWRGRSKYLYLSYGIQSLKNCSECLRADFGVALIQGRTYYLHKRPVARRVMIGIDWNRVDVNFAKYPDIPELDQSAEHTDLSIMQTEVGMGLGPSFTVSLVPHLRTCLYCRATPSASIMRQDKDFTVRYATFLNVGLTLSYKLISAGVEQRWNLKTDYGNLLLSREERTFDAEVAPVLSAGDRLRTNNFRVFFGFRW